MVEKKGVPPPGKTVKKRKCSIFTVFTADMVEKKGRPPEKIKNEFYRFYRADASD